MKKADRSDRMMNTYKEIDENNWERAMHGRTVMPLSVQANHSFVDGIHIGKFAEAIQRYMNEY